MVVEIGTREVKRSGDWLHGVGWFIRMEGKGGPGFAPESTFGVVQPRHRTSKLPVRPQQEQHQARPGCPTVGRVRTANQSRVIPTGRILVFLHLMFFFRVLQSSPHAPSDCD